MSLPLDLAHLRLQAQVNAGIERPGEPAEQIAVAARGPGLGSTHLRAAPLLGDGARARQSRIGRVEALDHHAGKVLGSLRKLLSAQELVERLIFVLEAGDIL